MLTEMTESKIGMLIVFLVAASFPSSTKPLPIPGNGSLSETLNQLMIKESGDESSLRDKRTIGLLRQLFPEVSKKANTLAEDSVYLIDSEGQQAESSNNEVRVQFDDDEAFRVSSNDVTGSEGLTPLEDLGNDDDNRNKRYLGFEAGPGTVEANGQSSGSGNSGNFIFDIIRLVAGSGSGSSGGEAGTGSPSPSSSPATEAVPGPVTRLFVVANRGISNLIQDLILRLAATSERIVNFKARLITSII